MTWDRAALEQIGFMGFVSFRALRLGKLLDVTEASGAYVVMLPGSETPAQLETSTGGWFKGRDPSVSPAQLKAKWLDNSPVVYIGKANRLRTRLRQFCDFGAGRPVGHWGGRYLWHLANSDDLVVAWKRCEVNESAAELESKLLAQFVADYGALPFANLRS